MRKIKCWRSSINTLDIAIPKNNDNIQGQQKGFQVFETDHDIKYIMISITI